MIIRSIVLMLVFVLGVCAPAEPVQASSIVARVKGALGLQKKGAGTETTAPQSPAQKPPATTPSSPGGQKPVPNKEVYNILALDGGGMRGIGTATILAILEMKTGKRIYDMFDMFIGTSTGGLIAIMLSDGQTATQILNFYIEYGPVIFQKTWSKRFRSVGGLIGTKYTTKQLERVIAQNTSPGQAEQNISQAKRPVGVTSYNVTKGEQHVISSWAQEGPSSNFSLKDAARATSAAPTYFKGKEVAGDLWIDGGVGANDPATSAYLEAKKFFPPGAKIRIVSIGTGTASEALLSRDSGIRNVQTIVSTLLKAGGEASQRAMIEKLSTIDPNLEYIRIQYTLPKAIDLADTRKAAVDILMKAAFDRTNQSDFINLKNALAQGK